MEPRLPEPTKMPELQLWQELKIRFPEINHMVLVKVMKMYGYDRDQCIQVLENKKTVSSILDGQLPLRNHNSNSSSQGTVNNSSGNGNSLPTVEYVGGSSGWATEVSSGGSGGMRLQELPVQHETKHISTVQHTLGPPALPPKPFSQPLDANPFPHPLMPSVPGRSVLFIDPANQVPVRPPDFTPFINSASRAEIPSIRCNPINASAVGRPVRVINVTNTDAGGRMTLLHPKTPSPRYAMFGTDSGCLISTSTASNSETNLSPLTPKGQIHWQMQETEGPATHSSSIFIDPATSPMAMKSTANIQDPSAHEGTSSGATSQQQYQAGVGGYLDSQGPAAVRQYQAGVGGYLDSPGPSAVRQYQAGVGGYLDSQGPAAVRQSAMRQPLNISLASQAPTGQSTYSGFPYSAPRYGPGLNADSMSSHGPAAGSDRIMMSVVNSERYNPQGGPSNHQRVPYPVGMVAQGVGQLTVSQIGPSVSTPAPVPSVVGSVSSPMLSKAPRLQQQRSTSSSTSRSDSLDSEHGSVGSQMASDFNALPPSGAFYNSPTSHNPLQWVGGGVQGIGMAKISPSSSQSSLSSESSSAHTSRELPTIRPRSGSLQEEAAYSQALLYHQHTRKQKLMEEMAIKQQLLNQLRAEVSEAEKKKIIKSSQKIPLPKGLPRAEDIARLCELNRRLLTDIQMYQNEIDMYKNGQTPFNVMDPMGQQNFFNNMPTGPNDLFTHHSHQRQTSPPPPPPPRPPLPRLPVLNRINSEDLTKQVPAPTTDQMSGGGSGDSEEGPWPCTACTFANHPALKKCEMCEMPRITGS